MSATTTATASCPEGPPVRDTALLIVGLEGLRRVNEVHGRLAGDRVVSTVAAHVVMLLRGWDVVVRCIGDEFVILAHGVDIERAGALADRMRRTIAALPMCAGGGRVWITASVGVASGREVAGETPMADLVMLAKERLDAAKRAGKNRVCGRYATEGWQ